MARYRLRFLLQEIDLPQGDTLIGRSAACHVSIEDPLVSRQHARLRIEGDRATIEDLGSRNGLQISGRTIQGVHELTDGDRIRIGTQEVVFCTGTVPSRRGTGPGMRQTGFMTHCAACDMPYPAELVECPSCGSNERTDDDTLTGVGESQRNWTLQLLVEVLAKAQSLGRSDDVERVLRRARANIEERLAMGQAVEKEPLDAVFAAAVALAVERREGDWGVWVLAAHASLGTLPEPALIEPLATLPAAQRAKFAPVVGRTVQAIRARAGPADDEREAFTSLESLERLATGGTNQ